MRLKHVLMIGLCIGTMACSVQTEKVAEPKVLTHLVFLDLKNDINEADIQIFEEQIAKLGTIEEALSINSAFRLESNDVRALKSDFVIQTTHKDLDALESYRKHPVHHEIIEQTKRFLSVAPVTFDF